MSEWWLVVTLVIILGVASWCLVYPLKHRWVIKFTLIPILFISVGVGYFCWGDFNAWQTHVHQLNLHTQAQQMLKTIKSPQELIDKLLSKLDDNPRSAKGWFLLGKLYSSQAQQEKATEAFAKAHALNPEDEQFTVFYTHSLWTSNNQQFNEIIRQLFKELLVKNPKQPDALAMLAMDAFMSHRNKEAIAYWQRLLQLTPPQSEEAEAIRKAIAKAENPSLRAKRSNPEGS